MKTSGLERDLNSLAAESAAKGIAFEVPRGPWNEKDIARLARTLDLDAERALLLTLKFRWEAFLAKQPPERRSDEDGAAIERGFDPDTSGMVASLATEGVRMPESEHSRARLRDLIRAAMLNGIHRMPLDSPECERFVANQRADAAMFDAADAETRDRLMEARSRWLCDCSLHADLLLALVNQQLSNARIRQRFMRVYGDVYVELEELAHRSDSLRARLRLKEADPSLSREAIEEEMREFDNKARQSLDDLKALAVNVPPMPLPGVGQLSAEQVEDYRRQVKDALRRVWRLLHPDSLRRREGYGVVSPRQRERLKELWHEIMKVRPAEMAFDPAQLGYSQRSIERILQAEREARAILESLPGIDLDARYQPRGDTPAERIEWYETECKLLGEDIVQTRAQLKALIDDPDVREQSAALDLPPQKQEEIRRQMASQIERHLAVTADLEQQLDGLFAV